MVRQIKTPASIPAVLLHGPLQQQSVVPDPLVENARSIDQNYALLTELTTKILQQLQGVSPPTGKQAGKVASWDQGVKFYWKNLADPAATDLARTTPVPRAWRNTTAWLRVVLANRTEHLTKAAIVEAPALRPPLEDRRPEDATRGGGVCRVEGLPVHLHPIIGYLDQVVPRSRH